MHHIWPVPGNRTLRTGEDKQCFVGIFVVVVVVAGPSLYLKVEFPSLLPQSSGNFPDSNVSVGF